MGKEMIVDTEYAGYVFVGWAAGRFKTEHGRQGNKEWRNDAIRKHVCSLSCQQLRVR